MIAAADHRSAFAAELEMLHTALAPAVTGRVTQVQGLSLRAEGLAAPVGSRLRIEPAAAGASLYIDAEVVGDDERGVIAMPLGDLGGVGRGDRVQSRGGGEHRPRRADAARPGARRAGPTY